MTRFAIIISAGCLVLSLTACGSSEPRPSVLLVVVDSLRGDRLHHAGDPRALTPRLDRLAAEGARFTRAYAPAPWTTPSVMSIFTGLTPASHHVDHNDRSLSPAVETLAQRLQEAGYATGAVMPALTLAAHFGFARGFDRFIYETQGHSRVSGPWSVASAQAFMRESRDGPFFLYVHLWDVHYNYNPPVPYSLRFQAGRPPGEGETDDVTALMLHEGERGPLPADRVDWLEGQYAGEVLFTDDQVGRLLDELERLGIAGDTIVVVTSDHGEAFQEHGVLGHTVHLYEEMEHVPLLLRWPGRIGRGKMVHEVMGLVDLAPTLLDLAGVSYEQGEFEGVSWAASLRPDDAEGVREQPAAERAGRSPVLVATSRRALWRGLRGDDMAYLFDLNSGREELYDLSTDPGQRENLAGLRPDETRRWRLALCERLRTPAPGGEVPIETLPVAIKEELDAGLRSLGYVGAARPATAPPGAAERTSDPAQERQRVLESIGCPAEGG
jgi:arylsulfatase A-like enzyme